MADELEAEITSLYRALLIAWNVQDAEAFAAPFTDDGGIIGFDGSEVNGRAHIAGQMAAIFNDHATGTYVGIVRDVRRLGDDAALLRAVSGVVPAGQRDVNPALNAIQSLIARRTEGRWQIVLYQNTPAQFHGRPELGEALTEDLRAELARQR